MPTPTLEGRPVAFLATDGVLDVELTHPWNAVLAAGAKPELVSLRAGTIRAESHSGEKPTFRVERVVSDVTERDYAALVLPGGVKNPDTLRMNEDAVAFVRGFMERDKPVAAICHGPWMLVEADAVQGRTLTSYPSLKTDIVNAGGDWVDREVIVDQKLVTSRTPDDLPAFSTAFIRVLTETVEERSLDRMVEQSFPASDPLPGPTAL